MVAGHIRLFHLLVGKSLWHIDSGSLTALTHVYERMGLGYAWLRRCAHRRRSPPSLKALGVAISARPDVLDVIFATIDGNWTAACGR